MSGDFNFKVKIVHTDLTRGDFLYNTLGGIFGGFRSESPIIYQNSSYISKLFFLNNYTGGILKKDRIEDMPEKYRRFIQFDNPTQAQLIREFKKEMIMLANREEVGQNVFYSGLGLEASAAGGLQTFESVENVEFVDFDGFEELEEFEYEDDGEEIKDILNLNNYFNSEEFKMSKVEYDFSSPGSINFTDDGYLDMRYDESVVTGVPGSRIQLLFKPDNKNLITIRRKSFFDACFHLEKGKRISIEVPETENNISMVFTTHTKELANNITFNGGNMRILYATETNGMPSEMILHTISAERTGTGC